jgi:CRP-like cAMP-binding protein
MKPHLHFSHELRNSPLLRNLAEDQYSFLLENTVLKEAVRGEIIYSKTDSGQKLFFLCSGRVKLVEINENGTEIIKDVLAENEIFGIAKPRDHATFEYAQVLTPKARFYVISHNVFHEAIRNNSVLSSNYASTLASRIHKLETRYINLAINDVKSRLLYILKEIAIKDSERETGTLILRNYLTQDEMAKMIFVSRQTLSRVLKDLRDAGEIRYKRGRIEIRDTKMIK